MHGGAAAVETLAVDLAVVPEGVPEDDGALHRKRHHAELRERGAAPDYAVAQLQTELEGNLTSSGVRYRICLFSLSPQVYKALYPPS